MHVRIFTLPFQSVIGGFDDTAVRDFIKDKQVLSIQDHFFVEEERPYLALVVTYQPARLPEAPAWPPAQGKQRKGSWRELLDPAHLPLFNTLRDWRNERSKQEGIPPYVICTNKQLARIVEARPGSLSALGEIHGIGKAKLKKYGKDLLALLADGAEPQEANGGALASGAEDEHGAANA